MAKTNKAKKKENLRRKKQTAEQLFIETQPYLIDRQLFDPLNPPAHLSSDAIRTITLFQGLRDVIQMLAKIKQDVENKGDQIEKQLAKRLMNPNLPLVER